MNLIETIRIAIRALMSNKTRSFLTVLGVIVGIGAVIAMLAVGEGAKRRVQDAFAQVGANMLIVTSGTTTTGGAQGGFGSLPTLTWPDLEAIRTELNSVRLAAPVLRSSAQVQGEEQNWSTSVSGTSPDYFALRGWQVEKGVSFTDADLEAGAKVAVLGQTVVGRVFGPFVDPVGRTIRIKNIPFEIIGVLVKKGQSPMGQDYDDAVFIPHNTYQAKIQGSLAQFINGVIMVSANTSEDTARAQTQIADLLRDRHRLAPGVDDDFSIRNLTEMAAAYQDETRTLSILLSTVAAFSLLVGGIGIMNIMLVSVTERTREIGLRMAVGAQPRDILAQFLVESLTLSFCGCALGVVLGFVGAHQVADRFQLQVYFKLETILLAAGFATVVGVVFGLYPAIKASRLDPITALRFE